jgi:hypothetical protein
MEAGADTAEEEEVDVAAAFDVPEDPMARSTSIFKIRPFGPDP